MDFVFAFFPLPTFSFPTIVPVAPGNCAKKLLNVRFSCTSTTMCWIGELEPVPEIGSVATGDGAVAPGAHAVSTPSAIALNQRRSTCLFRVYLQPRRLPVQKVRLRIFRRNYRKLARRLIEVQHVAAVPAALRPDAVGRSVRRSKPPEMKCILDKANDAAERIDDVRDVARLARRRLPRIRRNHDHRHAEAHAPLIVYFWRFDGIVVPTPVVPHDDDGRRVPIRALSDCVDDLCHPRRS